MVVHNEERILERKLQGLLSVDFAPDRLDIVVVSDGSSDGTDAILRKYAHHPRIKVVLNQLPRGKASGPE
jgi:glycosyltransferase involved in cell wall biosynthesis